MKRQVGFLLIALAICSLTACGALDALQATKQMPSKIDQTRDDTNAAMAKTNDGIHKQTLLVALDDMLKPEHTTDLNVPTGMMAGGETFALNATAEELAKLTNVFMREMETLSPDDSEPKKTPDGQWTPYAIKFDHDKLAKIYALMLIAGFTPQDKVEQLVREQINQGGHYEDYIYSFLALRALCIKTYFLDQGLFAKSIINPGMFDASLNYLKQIDYVVTLSFADRIAIHTSGLINKELNINTVVVGGTEGTNLFESDMTPIGLWSHLSDSYTNQLDPKYKPDNKNNTLTPAMLAKMRNMKNQIDQGVQRWSRKK